MTTIARAIRSALLTADPRAKCFATRQAARDYAPPQWVGLKFFNVYGPNEEHKHSMKSVASQIWPKVRVGHAVQLFKSYREGVPDGGQHPCA